MSLMQSLQRSSRFSLMAALLAALVFPLAGNAQGQSSGSQPTSQQSSGSPSAGSQSNGSQNQQQGQQTQSAPEAGGPEGDIGPIAVPHKKEEQAPPKKEEEPKPKKVEGMPDFSLRVNVPLVTVDVGVVTKDGQFVPGLKKEQFKITEDGVPQTISDFNQTKAPITAVMLVEFANNFQEFEYDALTASYIFAQTLKKEDWIALISYDIRPHLLQDFTQDKSAIYGGLNGLRIAMSAETNLFDALYDTMDRLETVEGRKYVILVSSGRDTFSKRNLDQILKKVQASKDIVIYSISTGQALRNYAETHGLMRYLCPITDFNCNMTYSQADNQMKTFAKMTGGKYYAPLFQGSFKDAFGDIANTVRNQYAISYHPTNRSQDGSYRKIKVELVDETGHPARMKDEKGHDVKYQVVAREGYKAKQQVE
jgi:VWFA-related protein